MRELLRILLLEDKLNDARLIQAELESAGIACQYLRAKTEQEYLDQLTPDIDLILADYHLPGFTALQALEQLQNLHLDIPFIIVSDVSSEEVAVECMKRGAADYLLKDRLTRLGRAVKQALYEKELRRYTQRLEQSEREQREFALALHETSSALTSTLDLDIVMNRILDNVGRVVPHDVANIMLIDDQTARFAYWRGYPEATHSLLASYRFSLDHPLFQEMLASNGPRLTADTAKEPRWTVVPGFEWIRSNLSAPIRAHGVTIGFLNLDNHTPNSFTASHAVWLLAFAGQAAIAIANAQLYQQVRQDAARLGALNRATSLLLNPFTSRNLKTVGNEIVKIVVKEFAQVDCGVLLVEGAEIIRLARSGEYEVQAKQPLYLDGPGLVAEAIRTGETTYAGDVTADPRYIASEPRTRSELVIPLRTGTRIIGVLDLQSPKLYAFGEQDQTSLEALASRAATVIENMQLYEQIRRHADELEQRINERTQEVLRGKNRVEAIINATSDAIILIRENNTIEQVNPAFVEMFGYQSDEMVGQSLLRLCDHTSYAEWMDALQTLRNRYAPVRLDLVARRLDGTGFHAEIALSLVSPDDASPVVCSLRDINARKRAEEELRTALERERELKELKSRFIAVVSHEVRNPLTVIQMSASMLESHGDEIDEQERSKHFRHIQLQVQHMAALVDDVLEMESVESGVRKLNRTKTDLVSLCQEIVDSFQKAGSRSGPIIYSRNGPQLEDVYVDAKLMRQLITNLVSNAVKYSPEESTILVELSGDGGAVHLRVKDEGIGIPEDDQERLFQAFSRAGNTHNIQGTGLGLVIAKNVVEQHGGTIRFESKVGVGTTFTVTIPLAADPLGIHP